MMHGVSWEDASEFWIQGDGRAAVTPMILDRIRMGFKEDLARSASVFQCESMSICIESFDPTEAGVEKAMD
jgi:hypothetical protein